LKKKKSEYKLPFGGLRAFKKQNEKQKHFNLGELHTILRLLLSGLVPFSNIFSFQKKEFIFFSKNLLLL